MNKNEMNLLSEKIDNLEKKAEELREKMDNVSGDELVLVDVELYFVEEKINKIKEVQKIVAEDF